MEAIKLVILSHKITEQMLNNFGLFILLMRVQPAHLDHLSFSRTEIKVHAQVLPRVREKDRKNISYSFLRGIEWTLDRNPKKIRFSFRHLYQTSRNSSLQLFFICVSLLVEKLISIFAKNLS